MEPHIGLCALVHSLSLSLLPLPLHAHICMLVLSCTHSLSQNKYIFFLFLTFSWNTALAIHLRTVYRRFRAAALLTDAIGTRCPTKPEVFITRLFTEKGCDPWSSTTCSWNFGDPQTWNEAKKLVLFSTASNWVFNSALSTSFDSRMSAKPQP